MQTIPSQPAPGVPRPSREEARRLGRARTLARRARARRIRRGVVGLTLALFIAAWVTIFAQLASGHDPALGAAARRATTAPATTGSSGSSAGATGSAAVGLDRAAQ